MSSPKGGLIVRTTREYPPLHSSRWTARVTHGVGKSSEGIKCKTVKSGARVQGHNQDLPHSTGC